MKKLLVIGIAMILMVAVIGSCFALYIRRADDITVDLGTESSISLMITDNSGSSLTLDTTDLNPDKPLIKNVKLSHNKFSTISATGNGIFKVALSGDSGLLNYIDMSATLVNGTTYNLNQLQQGITFYISNETEFTLKVFFKNISLDEYVTIAQKTIYITLTWKAAENSSEETNTPSIPEIESGYYIIGTFNDWSLDGSYKMDNSTKENCTAQKEEFYHEGLYEFRVVKYDSETKTTSELPIINEAIFGTEKGENNSIKVTISQTIYVYVNTNDEYFIKADPIS